MSSDFPEDLAAITRITIGRLHNLGNYEHVRYEVSIEVPPGGDPGSELMSLEQLLADLKPTPPRESYYVDRARQLLAMDPSNPTRVGQTEESLRQERAGAEKVIADHEAWAKRRQLAFDRFNQLNGTSKHTDAKLKWDDEF